MQNPTNKELMVLKFDGEIDLNTSPDMRDKILAVLEQGKSLTVDLSGVSYIDSSGIASLVEGLRGARDRGIQFRLSGVNQTVLQVLELARLDKVFDIQRDGPAALDKS